MMEWLITITGSLIWIAISIAVIFFGLIGIHTIVMDWDYVKKIKKW
tara:strand:- start:414 stop:551 length:138 start_codon:yes stop_codon:yes gene_type:complete